jgi:hypothetical protein
MEIPIKSALRRLRPRVLGLGPLLAQQERLLLLQGNQAAHSSRSLDRLRHLSEAEFRVYSQWGEDGILEWLIRRLPISSHRFIEFGVADYREANTRFLLVNRNWKGLVMDGSLQNMKRVREEEIYWRHDLSAVCAFIERDNIDRLIAQNGFCGNVGVLSIDIDGNDYWIWEAIDTVKADIVVCEYNAVFGDLHAVSVPYSPNFHRAAAHSSHLYFGASISALCFLARRNGYELVGTNHSGSNAFFVRRDLFPIIDAAVDDKSPLPSLARESRDKNAKLSFVGGLDRFKEIADMPVVQVDTGKTVLLRALGAAYSQKWLSQMCAE